jgi:hypothetical protein
LRQSPLLLLAAITSNIYAAPQSLQLLSVRESCGGNRFQRGNVTNVSFRKNILSFDWLLLLRVTIKASEAELFAETT